VNNPLPALSAISVLLSDTTEMGCELLCSALNSEQSGLRLVGGAVSCKQIVENAIACSPDVILLSLALQEGPQASFDALKQLRTACPMLPAFS
jgi:chemotaxis response regulator CheB